jgi:hypothetical protein
MGPGTNKCKHTKNILKLTSNRPAFLVAISTCGFLVAAK